MHKFLIGSRYFFYSYPDFHSKDIDELEIIETEEFKNMRQITGQNRCLFQLKRQASKDAYVGLALKANLGMVIGKFLVPEFCRAIGFTIKDLPKLAPLIAKLDEKHKYEEIIFNSYLNNNAFTLTKEQLNLAYESYKESRSN
jgi:hypothetical protein